MFAEKRGKYRWQDYLGYNYRALVEIVMFRYKTIVGEKMLIRDLPGPQIESKIGCSVLNKLAELNISSHLFPIFPILAKKQGFDGLGLPATFSSLY